MLCDKCYVLVIFNSVLSVSPCALCQFVSMCYVVVLFALFCPIHLVLCSMCDRVVLFALFCPIHIFRHKPRRASAVPLPPHCPSNIFPERDGR